VRDVFGAFLQLGLTSFGGPTAHLGYFRRAFVERRAWIDERAFATIVAFCSVLPGPTSSQVGMLIGLARAGPGGAFAAWFAFTAPSAVAMTACAFVLGRLQHDPGVAQSGWFAGALAGLGAAAAAVVAQAVWALARTLCTDMPTRAIGVVAAGLAIALAGRAPLAWVPIGFGALAGAFLAGPAHTAIAAAPLPIRVPPAVARVSTAIVLAIVVVLCIPPALFTPALALLVTIVRAGTLVFGGGHVVLPLLQSVTTSGLLAERTFFAGYGIVQAMPGPLFTFGTFIGAANTSSVHGIAGALAATVAIFAPSFALIFALAPGWDRVRTLPRAAAALRGVNASVVGLLASVLYHPMLTSIATNGVAIVIAVAAFAVLTISKWPPWTIVLGSALCGALAGTRA
jgi:chromate transporter